jgi:hypothetical protein
MIYNIIIPVMWYLTPQNINDIINIYKYIRYKRRVR